MDAEVVAHAVLLADAVQGDPGPRRVRDVVVPVVLRGPARHGALLDPVGEPALLRVLQEGNEGPLEVEKVLVHRVLLVAADEAAHGVRPEEHGGVHDPPHEVVLPPPDHRVLVEHVVEVGEVREADGVRLERRLHALRAVAVEGLAQVERVGHGVQHRLGRHVGLARVQRGGELDVVGPDLARERDPLLDGQVGIRVPQITGGELLQGGGQHADLHELRLEGGDGHGILLAIDGRTIRPGEETRQTPAVILAFPLACRFISAYTGSAASRRTAPHAMASLPAPAIAQSE